MRKTLAFYQLVRANSPMSSPPYAPAPAYSMVPQPSFTALGNPPAHASASPPLSTPHPPQPAPSYPMLWKSAGAYPTFSDPSVTAFKLHNLHLGS